MILVREIEWLIDRLLEEYPQLNEKTVQKRSREWLKARIIWGVPKGFTYFWGDERGTYGGIIIRPVNDELIARGTYDYWNTFWDYDPKGDIIWVDYAYGPGLYPQMLALCRSTGCPRLGWRHRDRMHIRPMERMPARSMKMAFHL